MSEAGERAAADGHVADLAELYALGALEPAEGYAVEAHAAWCADCARALGTAESTVAAVAAMLVPPHEPPERLGARIAASARAAVPPAARRVRPPAARSFGPWYATAAALVVAAGAGAAAVAEHTADVRQAAHDSAVLATIATSHFNHVTLTSLDARAPVSKVLYARDGAWLYVVIDRAACGCRVVTRSAAQTRDLGSPAARGDTATLFVRDAARPASVELVDASNDVIAKATLIYSH